MGTLMQSLFGTLPASHTLLLGTTDLIFLPLVLMMGIWTFGSLASQSPRGQTARIVAQSAFFLLLVFILVPHQLAFIVSFTILWISIVWNKNSEISTEVSMTVLFIMLFLVPFKATTLLVWARSLWLNWSHSLSTDHNLFFVGPAALDVALCLQGSHPKKRSIASLVALATGAFVFGSRWTWVLQPLGHIVLMFIAGIIW
ncbi:uncharacterized protein IL334_005895 [Kwoniella shivajii]|uniref:GPI inositol-deacylase transmembrane domain-containing protein n=1 Tax=Kwoniella shivajii TaxID=564305 RepID=A0ABZ1D4R1_9TREE|nr:hypothetical protein IL334_005895 [Kwoniella shivajii]